MAESPFEEHPLDRDDDAPPTPMPRGESKAYEPLLKPSIIVLGVSFVATFLSAVASSNAPFESPFAVTATFVFRASGMVMLGSFCAILIAYRIPYLKTLGADKIVRRRYDRDL